MCSDSPTFCIGRSMLFGSRKLSVFCDFAKTSFFRFSFVFRHCDTNVCFPKSCGLTRKNTSSFWFSSVMSICWCIEFPDSLQASGAKPNCTRTHRNDFVFPVRDIPLRFISLNIVCSAPMGRIDPFLSKRYDRFMIYRIPSFWRPKVLYGLLSSKKERKFLIFSETDLTFPIPTAFLEFDDHFLGALL